MSTLTGNQMSAALGVSRKTLYRWHHEGRLFIHEWTPETLERRGHLLVKRPRGPMPNRNSIRYGPRGRHTFRERLS